MFGLRDSNSIFSKKSDTFSNFSVIFDFDAEVLSSTVYQRVVRSSLKKAWKQPHRSQPKRFETERVLLLGDDEQVKDSLVNTIHDTYLQQCAAEDIATCRLLRLRACLEHTKKLIQTHHRHDCPLGLKFRAHEQNILMECSLDSDTASSVEEQVLDAMADTWRKAVDYTPCRTPETVFSTISPQ